MPAFGTNLNVMCYIDDLYVYLRRARTTRSAASRPASASEAGSLHKAKRSACMTGRRLPRRSLQRSHLEARCRSRRPSAACALLLLLPAPLGAAHAAGGPEARLSIELVDPKVLRVCADPHNMPFSEREGRGLREQARRAGRRQTATRRLPIPIPAGDRLRPQHARRAQVRRDHGLRRRATSWCRTPIPITATAYALVFKPRHGPRRVERSPIRG